MGKTRLKVGLFVTLSFFLFAATILWLAGSRFLQSVDTYTIYFTKSVSGLLPGAVVEYQGVTVGKVEALHLTAETPPRAQVLIALQPGTPVRRNTIAHLVGSFVTGIRFVQLEGGSADVPLLEPGGTIVVREGGLEEFRDRASEIAQRLITTLTRIEQDLLSQQNREAVTTFLRSMSVLAENLRTSIDEIATPDTHLALRAMVNNLAEAAAGIKHTTIAINEVRDELFRDGQTMLIQIRHTAEMTARLADEVAQLTRHIDELVVENRPQLHQLLTNLADASYDLKEASDTIRTDPSGLIWGKNKPPRELPDP
jgi:phospholipid/cholesterol/gamma-HCH transport system substrate-binding protein